MKPSRSELQERNLLVIAQGIARKLALTLEDMFDGRKTPARLIARDWFYLALRDLGWSQSETAALMGMHAASIWCRLKKYKRLEGMAQHGPLKLLKGGQ
jgi:hypothetical protein